MGTFEFRDTPIELVKDLDDLTVGDAEIIEAELGLDLQQIQGESQVRQLMTFVLISARRVFPDAQLEETRTVRLGPLLRAFEAAAPADPEPAGVDFTGTWQLSAGASDGGEVLSPTSAGSV